MGKERLDHPTIAFCSGQLIFNQQVVKLQPDMQYVKVYYHPKFNIFKFVFTSEDEIEINSLKLSTQCSNYSCSSCSVISHIFNKFGKMDLTKYSLIYRKHRDAFYLLLDNINISTEIIDSFIPMEIRDEFKPYTFTIYNYKSSQRGHFSRSFKDVLIYEEYDTVNFVIDNDDVYLVFDIDGPKIYPPIRGRGYSFSCTNILPSIYKTFNKSDKYMMLPHPQRAHTYLIKEYTHGSHHP